MKGQGCHFVFRSAHQTQTWWRTSNLASCQVSLNSVQRCQRRSGKCLSQSESGVAISLFWSARKTQKLGRGRWDLDSRQFSLNSVQRFYSRSRKCLSHSEAGRLFCFSDRPGKLKIGRKRWDLASCQVLLNSEFLSAVSWEESKMYQPLRGRGDNFVFLIGPKNTDLVEDVEILLPVRFRWIPFSGFREEVENVSAIRCRATILFFRSARNTQNW